ncbi:MAG: SGNH/GDSL hydrolase family protein [SAR202 cluster bacterium]|nr:SGNH/GDSL hydrolase family protein [SAR202 cluster bacterium]
MRATRIAVLTIDLGANDLLGHLGSPTCRANIRGAECAARIDAAIDTFEVNIASILDQLKPRIEPGTEFYVMTIYNPFDFGIGIPFEADSNEIIGGMNATLKAEAARVGAKVADAYPLMSGNAAVWTHMLTQSDIHPTADGYQALPFAFAQARDN